MILFPSLSGPGSLSQRDALALFEQLFEFHHELADVFEGAVNRRKAHISDRIGGVQLAHQRFTDDRTGNFFFTALLNGSLDAVRDHFDRIAAHRTLFARALQAVDDLEAIVAFAPAVLFHHQRHHLLNPLVSGKAPITPLALPPPPDHVAVLAQSRVDDSIAGLVAKGTFHGVNRILRIEDCPFPFSILDPPFSPLILSESVGIHWKFPTELADLRADRSQRTVVIHRAKLTGNKIRDRLHFLFFHPTSGDRRRADADATGHER